jgi:anti-anti-sigma factor
MMQSLAIHTDAVGEVNVVRCSGRMVYGRDMDALKKVVAVLLPQQKPLVLNLGGVCSIDSAGIGTLALLHCWVHAAGSRVSFCTLPPRIAELLHLTNLFDVFDLHASESDAIGTLAATAWVSGGASAVPLGRC